MKGLFIFDQALHEDGQGNYYDPIFTNEVFDRYLNHVDSLTVLARVRTANMKIVRERKIPQINLEKITIKKVPNLLSIKGLLQYDIARKIVKMEIEKADIIFIREPSVLESIACRYAKKYNKKYILEVGGCPWDTYWNQGYKGKIIAPIRYLSTKRCTKKADYVVYVTDKWLQNRYPTEGQNINCSNVNIRCEKEALDKRILKIENNQRKCIVIGSIGDYDVRSKGHRFVIMALKQLNSDKSDVKYIYQIVGSGDNTESKQIAEKYDVSQYVEFIPPMNHENILNWLDTIDIYAQPSRQEGLPRAVIEAMSRGTVVIGAKTGGIPELLQEKFVFSNSRSEVNEIADIIRNVTKETMIEQAKINFMRACDYDKNVIEKRRNEFFKNVVKSIQR